MVARLGQSVRVVIQRLVVEGLVEQVGTPKRRILRLTLKGLQHPAYEKDSEHLASFNESEVFKPALIKLMLALDVLGACAMDLTDVSGVKPKGSSGTGQYMQCLRSGGYVQQIKKEGGSPVYRLTKVAAISSAKGKGRALTAAEAQRRLAAAREGRTNAISQKLASGSSSVIRSSRTPELLDIISRQPGLTASMIQSRLTRPYSNPRSINVALKDFERQGRIMRLADAGSGETLWSITEGGAALLADLTSPPTC